jgi:hypothetical protein
LTDVAQGIGIAGGPATGEGQDGGDRCDDAGSERGDALDRAAGQRGPAVWRPIRSLSTFSGWWTISVLCDDRAVQNDPESMDFWR